MARPHYLAEIKAGLGVESACFYCRIPVFLVASTWGIDVPVEYATGLQHRCLELRRRHRKRQRANRTARRNAA